MILVGIVDDHPIVRSALRALLANEQDLFIVGEALDGRGAIDLVRNVALDVLVMDVGMRGQSGIDVLLLIQAKAPDVAILIFTGYPEEQYAIKLFQNGIRGYLSKDCDAVEILTAIRHVSMGRRYISATVAQLMAAQLTPYKEDSAAHKLLSDREFQIFLKLARGENTGGIATTLSLAPKTVSSHRARLMSKLQLKSNADLTYYAIKHRLLE